MRKTLCKIKDFQIYSLLIGISAVYLFWNNPPFVIIVLFLVVVLFISSMALLREILLRMKGSNIDKFLKYLSLLSNLSLAGSGFLISSISAFKFPFENFSFSVIIWFWFSFVFWLGLNIMFSIERRHTNSENETHERPSGNQPPV